MGKIRRLEDDLANQIAAGEVVERPASVAKELIENSLDAGATRVQVDIENGGMGLVRVTDDGEGMDADDARLAVDRHATSKIRVFDDLTKITSFGFRGEALPSIASVSRFTLRTRARDRDEGVEIVIEGGGAPRVRPAGSSVGTSIEVADLFFNVPARRKFVKASATESAHVGEVVLMAALSRPDITFVLTRDGRTAREYLRAGSRKERARQAVLEDRLEPCIGERGLLRVEAHLAPPERARTGAVALHLFVNGRPVKDRQLARAVAQAFGSVLDSGRYPVGVLYIDLPPELVDVNVHPQKAEVRFADARAVYDAVTRELHAALAKAFALPSGPLFRTHLPPRGPLGSSGSIAPGGSMAPQNSGSGQWSFQRAPAAVVPKEPDPWGLAVVENASRAPGPISMAPPSQPAMRASRTSFLPGNDAFSIADTGPRSERPRAPDDTDPVPPAFSAQGEPIARAPAHDRRELDEGSQPLASFHPPILGMPTNLRVPSLAPLAGSGGSASGDRASMPPTLFATPGLYTGLRFLAQVRNTFLLCEGRDGLYILDQHAAAERVAFDRLRRAYAQRGVATQRLLIAEVVELSATEVAALEEHADTVAKFGVELRAVGASAVAVHAVPKILTRAQPERIVRDLVAELSRAAKRPFSDAADLVLATMACHGSVRAGDRLAAEEATSLLASLDGVDFAGHCPHGRPIVTRLSFEELEHRVGRP